jgi:hypothetical protein
MMMKLTIAITTILLVERMIAIGEGKWRGKKEKKVGRQIARMRKEARE